MSDGAETPVVAAILINAAGEVLLARRPRDRPYGGCWEFPGGKQVAGETPRQALGRELAEELGIHVRGARPFMQVPYWDDGQPRVLDVWRVEGFNGEPTALEGQAMARVSIPRLRERDFPPPDWPVVTALALPGLYLITPEPDSVADFEVKLETALQAGVRLIQLRAKSAARRAYWAPRLRERCQAHGARWLLNGAPEEALRWGADGVHINSARLANLTSRPLGPAHWVAASCHNEWELAQAAAIDADFAVVSPVQPTPTHPQGTPLGWPGLARLCVTTALPVFALGGMAPSQLPQAWAHGAQGIALISAVWQAPRIDEAVRACAG